MRRHRRSDCAETEKANIHALAFRVRSQGSQVSRWLNRRQPSMDHLRAGMSVVVAVKATAILLV
jgi:hypothetical protein